MLIVVKKNYKHKFSGGLIPDRDFWFRPTPCKTGWAAQLDFLCGGNRYQYVFLPDAVRIDEHTEYAFENGEFVVYNGDHEFRTIPLPITLSLIVKYNVEALLEGPFWNFKGWRWEAKLAKAVERERTRRIEQID